MFVIEKNIPIPSHNYGIGKYPVSMLEVGDSFFVKYTKKEAKPKQFYRVSATVKAAAKRASMQVVVRTVENGIRVWRTA